MMLVFTGLARDDIADIYVYNSRRSTAAADRIEASFRTACPVIAEFPLAAPATSLPGVRRAPMFRYPYTIYYRYKSEAQLVEILRVVYSARVRDLDVVPDD
jgi:plasmid stabilization system protein ParE